MSWRYKLPDVPSKWIFTGEDGLQYYHVRGSIKRIARYWSPQMVCDLVTLYPDHENAELARMFRVNANTLATIARGLGLKKSKEVLREIAKKGNQKTREIIKQRGGKTGFVKHHNIKKTTFKQENTAATHPVRRLDTGEIFISVKEAAKSIGCGANAITRAHSKKRHTVRGVPFAYIPKHIYNKITTQNT